MALTAKQQAIVDCHQGNHKEAAALAGVSESYVRQLMMDGTKRYAEPAALAVQEAIKERNKGKNDGLIATREERQEFWTKEMRDEESQKGDRLRASELLGKSELDFSERGGDGQTAIVVQINGVSAPQIDSKASKALEGTTTPKTTECESREA